MSQLDESPKVLRITLPSGRSLSVLRRPETSREEPRQLHVCPACKSQLVQPHRWRQVAATRWEITLECPDCFWAERGTYNQTEVEMFEEQIDLGVGEVLADLRRLTQANMAVEIDSFVSALHADHVLPEDF